MKSNLNSHPWITNEYVFLFRRDVFERGYEDAKINREPLRVKMLSFLDERHYGEEDSQRVLACLEGVALRIFDRIPPHYSHHTWIIEAVREMEKELSTSLQAI